MAEDGHALAAAASSFSALTSAARDDYDDDADERGDGFAVKQMAAERVDGPFLMACKQLRGLATRRRLVDLAEAATLEIQRISLLEAELRAMQAEWGRFLELLKLHDELSMVSLPLV